ncbi:Fic family protein [Acidihalobacter prosperus]
MKLYKQDIDLVLDQLGLSESESAVLRVILTNDQTDKRVRTSDIEGAVDLSRSQVIRLLKKLVSQRLLMHDGSGPQSGYRIDEHAIVSGYMKTDWLLRSEKFFDLSVIKDYEPNKTRLMPVDVSDQLKRWSENAIKTGDTLNETIFRRYLIDFAWASSRMEGNSYTLVDTKALIEQGIEAKDKPEKDAQMIRNHAAAIEYIINHARDIQMTPDDVLGIHALLSRGLVGDQGNEGHIRESVVEINRSLYRPINDAETLREGLSLICEKAGRINDPHEQSLFLMVRLAQLQPFVDVNKRTARLLANIPLLRSGYCPISFYGLDAGHYITGMLAFYETGSPALMLDAYKEGYAASVDRFISYRHRLAEHMGNHDGKRTKASDNLIKQFVTAVAMGRAGPDDQATYLREQMKGETALSRDALFVETQRRLKGIDSIRAAQLGISPKTYHLYKDAVERFDQPANQPKKRVNKRRLKT